MNFIKNIDIVEWVVKVVEKLGLEGEVGAWAKSDLWLNRGAMEIFKRTTLYRKQRRAAVLKWTAILSTLILIVASQSTSVAKLVRWVCDCVAAKATQFGQKVMEVNRRGLEAVVEDALCVHSAENEAAAADPESPDQGEESVDEAQVDVVKGVISQDTNSGINNYTKDPEPSTRQEAIAHKVMDGADDDISLNPSIIASCLEDEFRQKAAEAAAHIDRQKKEAFDILEKINKSLNFLQRRTRKFRDSIKPARRNSKSTSNSESAEPSSINECPANKNSSTVELMESLLNRSSPTMNSGHWSSSVQSPNISCGRTTKKRYVSRLLVGGIAVGTLGSCWLLLRDKLKWLITARKLANLPKGKILSIALTEWTDDTGSVARQLLSIYIRRLLVGPPENQILKRFLFISTTSVGTTGAIAYAFKQLQGLSLMLSRCCIKGVSNLVSKGLTQLAVFRIWLPVWIRQHLSSIPLVNSLISC